MPQPSDTQNSTHLATFVIQPGLPRASRVETVNLDSGGTHPLIDIAISRFHQRIESGFRHLNGKNNLDDCDIAPLSRALADSIPVPDLSVLTELGSLRIAHFEYELHHAGHEAEDLLDAFMGPLGLPWSVTREVCWRVKGIAFQHQSVPARHALKLLWGTAHASAAHRICPAVGKVFVGSRAHGYNLFINEAYARALEYILRHRS
ncbi:hypothetical protein [Parazoarcus communis]|jgi:hypothetical protein|uniref:Uncharacterized protein n=1 Tax=Parazoarcus communis SWub3 = DSM 12120 TaxID=1121029 RepID=A0A323V2V1_9RHOO|nr:hypothetical protein [Parazoarcus communis]NMG69186.1 hypothetical protein [Parazoarcus communis SWub3 = DSM 12120]PZA18433.1 hypothetical protein DNK49_02575 [Azoarcus communis] [Parazoarcus communis SWub3 = DSM 12120]